MMEFGDFLSRKQPFVPHERSLIREKKMQWQGQEMKQINSLDDWLILPTWKLACSCHSTAPMCTQTRQWRRGEHVGVVCKRHHVFGTSIWTLLFLIVCVFVWLDNRNCGAVVSVLSGWEFHNLFFTFYNKKPNNVVIPCGDNMWEKCRRIFSQNNIRVDVRLCNSPKQKVVPSKDTNAQTRC